MNRTVMVTVKVEDLEMIDKAGYGEESELWNAILVVENKNIYVNKEVMMLASPVFQLMFTAPFKETQTDPITVELPTKTIQTVIWMLDYLYPDRQVDITDVKAAQLLHLAEEYQICNLKAVCTSVLMKMENPRLEIVTIAERYNLPELLQNSIKFSAHYITPAEIDRQLKLKVNEGLSDRALLQVYKIKLEVTKNILHEVPIQIAVAKGSDNKKCGKDCIASQERGKWKNDIQVIPDAINMYRGVYGDSNRNRFEKCHYITK